MQAAGLGDDKSFCKFAQSKQRGKHLCAQLLIAYCFIYNIQMQQARQMSPNQGSHYINDSLFTQWNRRIQIFLIWKYILNRASKKRPQATMCNIIPFMFFEKIFSYVQKSGKIYGKDINNVPSKQGEEAEIWDERGSFICYGSLEIFTIITYDN